MAGTFENAADPEDPINLTVPSVRTVDRLVRAVSRQCPVAGNRV